MRHPEPRPGRDERLEYNGRELTESHCRMCRRVMIEHHSRACRTCRKDKPEGWIFGQAIIMELEVETEAEEDDDL